MKRALKTENRTIWIDLDNSPHVPLFAPIIKHYRNSGIEVILTARDYAQTIELLQLTGFGDTFKVIGKHYGKGKLAKIQGLLVRARQLTSYIRLLRKSGTNIAVAFSHGSRSMVLAARWLKIPVVTMYDYEFTETLIFNRFSDKVIVPEMIPDAVLDEIGLAAAKRLKYPGIKEELYMREFQPTPDFCIKFLEANDFKDGDDRIIVVLRPPATTANYHSSRSVELLNDILRFLSRPGVFTIIVPRTPEQSEDIRKRIGNIPDARQNCIVLNEAVSGLDLVFASDLLISGGGTMNREAALLGVPVYSIFAGRQGALDAQMEKEGSITFIRNKEDIAKIKLVRRHRDGTGAYASGLTDRVERFVIEQIDPFL